MLTWVCLGYAVCKGANLTAGIFPENAFRTTTWPMTYNNGQVLIVKFALHTQKRAGTAQRVAILVNILFVECLNYFKNTRIINQGAVYAPFVRSFYVNIFKTAFLHLWL